MEELSMKNISRISATLLTITLAFTIVASASEEILHNFTGGKDGAAPDSKLVADTAGNLYGTTAYGDNVTSNCQYGCGVIFELTPTASGPWKETILYHFTGGRDGYFPTSLALDAAGNLYGITYYGGQPARGTKTCLNGGCGTVFRLSHGSNGWTYNLLHTFTGRTDGATPEGITLGAAGNVFVTTFGGAPTCPPCNGGAVFELIGGVTGSTVHEFTQSTDLGGPTGPVLIDSAGNLYGTALGSTGNSGGIYQIIPGSGGTWTESVIYFFTNGNDGSGPYGGLAMDSSGNLYGTASLAGANASGTVFELTPGSVGAWSETTVYAFTGGKDGANPSSGVTMDAAGNLFGVAASGGYENYCPPSGCGAIFELTPSSTGWTEITLHTFVGKADGTGGAPVFIDKADNLYAASPGGGRFNTSCPSFGCGLIYEFPSVGGAVK
jgi:hypothetical protein